MVEIPWLTILCTPIKKQYDYPHHSEETSKRVSFGQKSYKSLQIQQIGLLLEYPTDRSEVQKKLNDLNRFVRFLAKRLQKECPSDRNHTNLDKCFGSVLRTEIMQIVTNPTNRFAVGVPYRQK